MVYEPAILLLDEPLSNLDAKLREQMRLEIRALQKKLVLTVLYVTHDQAEAMTLSDRIAVMNRGRFEQLGTPSEVYETPATRFVAEFLGRTVSFLATVARNHAGVWLEPNQSSARIAVSNELAAPFGAGDSVCILIRPEDIEILPAAEPGPNQLAATIEQAAYLGDHFEYQVRCAEASFLLPAPKNQRFPVGSSIRLMLQPERIRLRAVDS
jgi:ABC-type Fe3+/spermidine/putrescine transport system ATPase subunit